MSLALELLSRTAVLLQCRVGLVEPLGRSQPRTRLVQGAEINLAKLQVERDRLLILQGAFELFLRIPQQACGLSRGLSIIISIHFG